MLRDNALDRFEHRHYGRRIIIATFILLGAVIVPGFVTFAVLTGSGNLFNSVTRGPEISAVTTRTTSPKPKSKVTGPTQPVIQPAPTFPKTSFGQNPEQNEMNYKRFSKDNPPSPEWLADVPMVARPHRRDTGKMPEAVKSSNSNQENKNEKSIEKPKALAKQAPDTEHQSKPTALTSATSAIEARKVAAIRLEQSYANAGVDISTHVSGANGTVLELQYLEFDDATVQKIMNVNSFAATLGKIGFTKIIFAGDQNKTWTFPLHPPSRSDIAPQEPGSVNNASHGQPAPVTQN
jgi:hypothetical protein